MTVNQAASTPHKLIVLDRDGVINQDSDDYVKSVDEWIPLTGSIEAITRLSKAGFLIAIATNQSGIARKYFNQRDLDAMHTKMETLVTEAGGKIDYIAYCPHGPDDCCDCRKPLPGLIKQIEQALDVNAAGGVMVGDSLRDLQAGQAVDMHAVLVKTGKGERTLAKGEGLMGVSIFDDLAAFVDDLLNE